MKFTLELPDGFGRRFKATIPNGRRSRLVADEDMERIEKALKRVLELP